MRRIPKAIRRAKFFEMISRLSIYAQTRGINLVPFKFHSNGLGINLAVLKDGSLSFD